MAEKRDLTEEQQRDLEVINEVMRKALPVGLEAAQKHCEEKGDCDRFKESSKGFAIYNESNDKHLSSNGRCECKIADGHFGKSMTLFIDGKADTYYSHGSVQNCAADLSMIDACTK